MKEDNKTMQPVKGEITGTILKELFMMRISKKEQAELDSWRSAPANQALYEALVDRKSLELNYKFGQHLQQTSWLTMKRVCRHPHFDGNPVPWPHKESRHWLLEQLISEIKKGTVHNINIQEMEGCLYKTVEEMVEYRTNLMIAGHPVITMDLVLDVLSAAYNDELLPNMPTKEGIKRFNALMK